MQIGGQGASHQIHEGRAVALNNETRLAALA
jgi:hypothetical protein